MLAPVHESKKLSLWRGFLEYFDGPFQDHLNKGDVNYASYRDDRGCRCLAGWYMYDVHQEEERHGDAIKETLQMDYGDTHQAGIMAVIIGSGASTPERRSAIVQYINQLESKELPVSV